LRREEEIEYVSIYWDSTLEGVSSSESIMLCHCAPEPGSRREIFLNVFSRGGDWYMSTQIEDISADLSGLSISLMWKECFNVSSPMLFYVLKEAKLLKDGLA